MTRGLFTVLGWCAVATALAGIVVPGLPTTVFVIAASYCFSRSSGRFDAWLRRHRWLGPILAQAVNQGGMSRTAKRRALVAMWTAVLVSSLLLASRSPLAALTTTGLGVLGTLSILFAVRTVDAHSDLRS